MGRSLAWELTLAEMPGFAAFAFQNVNNAQEHPPQQPQPGPNPMIANAREIPNNVNFQENRRNDQVQVAPENQNHENQANLMQIQIQNRQNAGPVFEYCAHIRRYGLHLPMNNRNTADCRFTLLRLFNNYTDFSSDYSRIMRKHTVFMSKMADSILSDGGTIDDSRETQILEAHCEFNRECNLKLLPRVKRIQLSCNYHIQSIERLFKSQSEGQLPSETISPAKLDYLRLSAYPVLKDIKKYTEKDVNTIHQHTQMIFPIIKDMDSRSRRSKGQGQDQITCDTCRNSENHKSDSDSDIQDQSRTRTRTKSGACICSNSERTRSAESQTEYTELFPLLTHQQMREQLQDSDSESEAE